MIKKLIGVALFAFSLALGQSVFADCGQGLRTMVDSLKLDAAQKEKIKPILEQLATTAKENGPQILDVSKQINQQTTSASMDQSTVDGLVDKKTKLIGDLMKAKISARYQILQVLTEPQKAQLQAKFKSFEDKMEAKFQSCRYQE